jgi:electron-transferring-flavoprotein dehydrogenase
MRQNLDRLSSVYLSNTNHADDQPCHLQLKLPELAIATNHALFDSPEQRYCPAGVYEIVRTEDAAPQLRINAQNCLHCKTCDIKDPGQNITWLVPQGARGRFIRACETCRGARYRRRIVGTRTFRATPAATLQRSC